MKKVIVIGATGSLAKYVIPILKSMKDVQLTLFVEKADRNSIKEAGKVVSFLRATRCIMTA